MYKKSDSSLLLFLLFVVSFLPSATKTKNHRSISKRKTLRQRLEESLKRSLEEARKNRQKLWNIIKIKRKGESDIQWIKRLKKYGFTTNGTHIRTGINYHIYEKNEVSDMKMDVKDKLKQLEGEQFYTVTGKSYTYEFVGENAIKPSRANQYISLADFERAIEINPTKLSQIRTVRGPSYVFGIITDKRFSE